MVCCSLECSGLLHQALLSAFTRSVHASCTPCTGNPIAQSSTLKNEAWVRNLTCGAPAVVSTQTHVPMVQVHPAEAARLHTMTGANGSENSDGLGAIESHQLWLHLKPASVLCCAVLCCAVLCCAVA